MYVITSAMFKAPQHPAIAGGPQTLQGAANGHKIFEEDLNEFWIV